MEKSSLYKSIGLHLAVIILITVDLPSFYRPKLVMGQAPIIVDLSEVKISEMTNLPPKAEVGEETKKAVVEKKQETYTHTEEKEPEEQVEAEEKAPENSFLEAPKPEPKPKAPEQKKKPKPLPPKPSRKPKPPAQPKPEPKKEPQEQKKQDNKPEPKKEEPKQLANPLKSLMDSVDELKAEVGETAQKATIAEGTNVQNMGIEGGVDGSYFSELAISETDLIASRLRECWNLDPGAMGIKDMIIEIRAYLNQDGSVRDVKILDMSRYNSDGHFRSIAESARRAVFICAPYSVFAEKYPDKYDMWKTLMLRFNPMDGGVH